MSDIDYTQFFSPKAKSRTPSAVRDLQRLQWIPGMISFGGGLPNPATFPIASINVKLTSGENISLDLDSALQYGPSQGIPELLKHLHQFQSRVHGPGDWSICVGAGSQDLLTKCFEMILGPGDIIVIENPGYVGALSFLKTLDVQLISVKTDKNGIVPDDLERILKNNKIKALYTCPSGGNPTGLNTSLENKKTVVELSRKHKFLILEDDPYYFIQFVPKTETYLSLCPELTIRFDSFSKIMSSGMRLGFATAPGPLIYNLVLDYQTSSLSASNISQSIILEIFNKWGIDGIIRHTDNVQALYLERRNKFCTALKSIIPNVEFVEPKAGMFVWIKLPVIDTGIYKDFMEEFKILFVPGKAFTLDETSSYIRLSYSIFKDEELYEGLNRLKRVIETPI